MINRRDAIALFRLGPLLAEHKIGEGWGSFGAKHHPVTGARVAVLESRGLFRETGPHFGMRTEEGAEALIEAFPHAIRPRRTIGPWQRYVEAEGGSPKGTDHE